MIDLLICSISLAAFIQLMDGDYALQAEVDTWLASAVAIEVASQAWVEPSASSGSYDDEVGVTPIAVHAHFKTGGPVLTVSPLAYPLYRLDLPVKPLSQPCLHPWNLTCLAARTSWSVLGCI